MKHYAYNTVAPAAVTNYNSTGTTMRVLIPKDEAPHFIMRRFEVAPGGSIGVHSHPEEHEIYVLEGELQLVDGAGKKERVASNEFVFVPSNEPHGYLNAAKTPAAFICVIPI